MSYVLNDANSRKKQRRMELHLIIFRPLNVMNIGRRRGGGGRRNRTINIYIRNQVVNIVLL